MTHHHCVTYHGQCKEANTTHMRVLKSRYTGDVGIATHLLYNRDTGRLAETFPDDEEVAEL